MKFYLPYNAINKYRINTHWGRKVLEANDKSKFGSFRTPRREGKMTRMTRDDIFLEDICEDIHLAES